MIELILNLISAGLLAAGSIFVLIGAFGLIRLPDFYTRLHMPLGSPIRLVLS